MILKAATKVNSNGWRRQITIDFNNKTIKTGAFQFHSGDLEDLSTKQYKQMIDFFIAQGFKNEEV
jgi:hypothetical protein